MDAPEAKVTREVLKQALITGPYCHSWMCRNYSTTAEASSPAVSAILSQLDENRKEHLIHHATRSSNKGEKNYSTNERDVLDVFFALKLLRHYLLCQNFNQFKDYEAMKYVVSNRDLFGMISR